ncbi:hypothetical protein K438DRAFT_1779103 [Mycena galopus ATCC 62051]|nr:hypothetical protein K438DRAFT_1779103 [Mycena galopus ATCC 62051]
MPFVSSHRAHPLLNNPSSSLAILSFAPSPCASSFFSTKSRFSTSRKRLGVAYPPPLPSPSATEARKHDVIPSTREKGKRVLRASSEGRWHLNRNKQPKDHTIKQQVPIPTRIAALIGSPKTRRACSPGTDWTPQLNLQIKERKREAPRHSTKQNMLSHPLQPARAVSARENAMSAGGVDRAGAAPVKTGNEVGGARCTSDYASRSARCGERTWLEREQRGDSVRVVSVGSNGWRFLKRGRGVGVLVRGLLAKSWASGAEGDRYLGNFDSLIGSGKAADER